MKKAFIINFCLFALLMIFSMPAHSSDAEEHFIAANQAYKNGDYAQAVQLYSSLIEDNHTSGDMYYNLANAYLKSGDTGHAILNYERAKLLIPRDADLNFNRAFAQDKILDAQSLQPGLFKALFFWLDSITSDELFVVFALFNVLFFSMLIFRLFRKPEWSFTLMIILFVLWGMSGLSFALTWHNHLTDNRGVIVNREVSVLSGPDTKETELFKLHAGTIIEAERTEGDWTLIRLNDEKRGWIQMNKLGLIRPKNIKK